MTFTTRTRIVGHLRIQNCGSYDDFEHELRANTDKNNMRIEPVICATEFLKAYPSLAVLIGFFDREEDWLGLLRTNN